MTIETFIETVAKMRHAQKEYFLFRNKTDLKKSMHLERIIDEELKIIKAFPDSNFKQLELKNLFS